MPLLPASGAGPGAPGARRIPRRRGARALGPSFLVPAALMALGPGCQGPSALPEGSGEPVAIVEGSPVRPHPALPPVSEGVLHVTDLVPVDDGWWILDRRAHRLHRTGPDFQVLASAGARGEAPGAFRSPSALALRADRLLLLEAGDQPVLHMFDLEGNFVERERIVVAECSSFQASSLSVEVPTGAVLLAGTCLRRHPETAMGAVVVHVPENGLPRVVENHLRPASPESMNPETAVVTWSAGQTWSGRSFHPCLAPVASTGDQVSPGASALCLDPWEAVRLPIETMAARIPDPRRAALLSTVLGNVPWFPVMDRIFPHAEGVILRRITGLESRELVLLGLDGASRVLASGLPQDVFVHGDQVIVAWEGADGMHLEARALPDG
jgi:hypothetical protein